MRRIILRLVSCGSRRGGIKGAGCAVHTVFLDPLGDSDTLSNYAGLSQIVSSRRDIFLYGCHSQASPFSLRAPMHVTVCERQLEESAVIGHSKHWHSSCCPIISTVYGDCPMTMPTFQSAWPASRKISPSRGWQFCRVDLGPPINNGRASPTLLCAAGTGLFPFIAEDRAALGGHVQLAVGGD